MKFILAARKLLDLSQKEFAVSCGISASLLKKIERTEPNGLDQTVTMDTALKIFAEFGFSLRAILENQELKDGTKSDRLKMAHGQKISMEEVKRWKATSLNSGYANSATIKNIRTAALLTLETSINQWAKESTGKFMCKLFALSEVLDSLNCQDHTKFVRIGAPRKLSLTKTWLDIQEEISNIRERQRINREREEANLLPLPMPDQTAEEKLLTSLCLDLEFAEYAEQQPSNDPITVNVEKQKLNPPFLVHFNQNISLPNISGYDEVTYNIENNRTRKSHKFTTREIFMPPALTKESFDLIPPDSEIR